MLADPSFWVAVGFVLFVAFFIWKAAPGMLASLDQRALSIKKQFDEARDLREQAEKLLAEYRNKHAQAMEISNEIIENAKVEALNMKTKATRERSSLLERREKLALEKISRAGKRAEQEVKIQAVDYAVLATRAIIAEKLDTKDDNKLIAATTQKIPEYFPKHL